MNDKVSEESRRNSICKLIADICDNRNHDIRYLRPLLMFYYTDIDKKCDKGLLNIVIKTLKKHNIYGSHMAHIINYFKNKYKIKETDLNKEKHETV